MKPQAHLTKVDDEVLARQWRNVDWDAAQKRLDLLQEKIARAERDYEREELIRLEDELVSDIGIRYLAVRHVVNSKSGPGTDGERWRSEAEMFRAACSLTPDGYEANPKRLIKLVSRNSGKERNVGVPSYRDKAMMKLYAYVLQPIVEASCDGYSYGFRKSRSAMDAHASIMRAIMGHDAPKMVVVTDVKACYAHISHDWILENVPINKHVLYEFIHKGYVYAGKLFELYDHGISEGSNISPYIANLVLNGLQRHIYRGLHGPGYVGDLGAGRLVNFADDILVTVRSYEQGLEVIELIQEFLTPRGLGLSPEKTQVVSTYKGFTFLSRTYTNARGHVKAEPSEEAIERFKANLAATVDNWTKSQRELIERLNKMLAGWANYHRCTEALVAFKKIDLALEAILVRASVAKHRRWRFDTVVKRYFYEEHGEYYYSLPDDRSVRVIKLEKVILTRHFSEGLGQNPYLKTEHRKEKEKGDRERKNVTGKYKSVWKRQGGRCHYCGEPILIDQGKSIVAIDPTKPEKSSNLAYVHNTCKNNIPEVYETDDPLTGFTTYDVLRALEETLESGDRVKRMRRVPGASKYQPLMHYLDSYKGHTLTLTFKQIEDIIGAKLPKGAYSESRAFWNGSATKSYIRCAWTAADWSLAELDLEGQTIKLVDNLPGYTWAYMPPELTEHRIPDDCEYELAKFHAYLIKKYGLNKTR